MRSTSLVLLAGVITAHAANFAYEAIQLTEADIAAFGDVAPGTPPSHARCKRCREFPRTKGWPSATTWAQFNQTLGGVLLQPVPAAAACYPGAFSSSTQCAYLVDTANKTRFWIDDPLTMLSEWAQGDTCMVSRTPKGDCTRGAYPEYVVNATTVKHIQAAVNFARIKNLRLVVKNTGHDFGGRSGGAGSLSVWVHHMKATEFLDNYTSPEYTGKAVRIGAGVEAWEMYNNVMGPNNVTVVAPEWGTVGQAGGWLQGAGHSNVVGTLGFGADNVLSFQVVLADGRFVTADSVKNSDLFWALRGGGGGTYGIVTSVVMKVHAQTIVTLSKIEFKTLPPGSQNGTVPLGYTKDDEQFWAAVNIYFKFCATITDTGGMCFGWINLPTTGGYQFTSTQYMINTAPGPARAINQPLYDALAGIDLRLTNPNTTEAPFGKGGRSGTGNTAYAPNQTRYRSRLFPRANWDDEKLFNASMAAIRACTEAGYRFHHNMHSPTLERVGKVDNAVLPAYRDAIMHAMIQEQQLVRPTAGEQALADQKVNRIMDLFRAVSPGSGAYMNEGDPGEPGWQQAFYGQNYARLLEVKKKYDEYNVFWAPTTVGSEGWKVVVQDGVPDRQNGKLCRVH